MRTSARLTNVAVTVSPGVESASVPGMDVPHRRAPRVRHASRSSDGVHDDVNHRKPRVVHPEPRAAHSPGVARARSAPTACAKTYNAVEPPSAPRRSLLAAGLAVATTFAAPASALALDLDALRGTLAENNKDILPRDPERFLNPAEIELESELGPPETP